MTTSIDSTWPSGQLVITTFSGSSTPNRRGAVRFKTARTECSSSSISWTLSAFETPISVAKSRMPSAGKPRRRSPEIVGIRGSSQPRTWPSSTSRLSTRFESTV